jgi:hypothetical protein
MDQATSSAETHTAAQMKDPRQRIGPLPACGQPGLQIEVLILAHQRVVDQLAHALGLRISPLSKVEIVRRAFDEEVQRVRVALHGTTSRHRQRTCDQEEPGGPSFRAFAKG